MFNTGRLSWPYYIVYYIIFNTLRETRRAYLKVDGFRASSSVCGISHWITQKTRWNAGIFLDLCLWPEVYVSKMVYRFLVVWDHFWWWFWDQLGVIFWFFDGLASKMRPPGVRVEKGSISGGVFHESLTSMFLFFPLKSWKIWCGCDLGSFF